MKNLLKSQIDNNNPTSQYEDAGKANRLRDMRPSESNPKRDTKTDTIERIEPKPPKRVKKKRQWKKALLVTGTLVLLAGGLITIFGVLPARQAYAKSQLLIQSGREFAAEIKNQNLEAAQEKLPEIKARLIDTQTSWDKIYLAKYTPLIKVYHSDGEHAIEAALAGIEAAEIAIEAIEPYADLLGLKAGSSFVAGSADERIQTAVKTMDKLTPKVGEIADKIEIVNQEIEQIDPGRYPEKIGDTNVRSKLIESKELINETTKLFLDARPLLEVLPQLLGEPEPKRYMVLFLNDKELRPTGGFITAFANFRVESGKFLVEKSVDIYELDDQISPKVTAPEEILTYHKGVYYFNIRDSNLSPDFAESAKQFIELYPGEFEFDGMIAVDTHVLVEAIKILGEFHIAGRTFSEEIDERCDCPKVIYELEDYATRPVAYVRETRKDILGALLLEIMKKALGVSPSQYWGQLFQMGLTEIEQKHIFAYMLDEQAQIGIESLNMGGRVANGTEILGYRDGQNWDYLHINDANMAGAKSNLFVEHYVNQDYEIEDDGTIIKTVTIDYKNPAPMSDCNLESGGLCLNGIMRNWARIYVPKASELIENTGSQNPKDEKSSESMKVGEDLGKTVYEGFLTVRPLGAAQLIVKYKLPFKAEGRELPVLIQKQGGTEGHEYTTTVNGKQKDQFELKTDTVKTVKL